ncbi:maleylpyruvate isomerase N-terminal domain-containing protein [Streptomyces sp. NPDC012769]|uniref:maleylpyruvate isomerase N-terminal domain-containing protein n=1 Tax=Streptomyces sp. NPDC012769 TaxID=3364848 RepID=UPI0036D18F9B
MTFDPVAEHARTRAALGGAMRRLVRLLRDVPDLDAASGVPVWSVGDVGAHLVAAYLAYGSAFGDEPVEWDGLLPPDEGPLAERVAAVNATSIALFQGADRARLGDFVAERGETFLRATGHLAPDTPVATPWLGPKVALPLSAATGMLLSESLVHGLDIARGAGLPWSIPPEEARLVIGQAMPSVMPLALDTKRAQGVSIAFDVTVKGGPRLAVVVDDGAATVTRDAPPRAYDCRIVAAPTAFLLVSFRRTPLWKEIARGRMRAGGRKPWLATRLNELITTP